MRIDGDDSINICMNTIKCFECGKQFKFLNNTHLRRHGLTIQEYKSKWCIEGRLIVDELRKVRGAHTRGKTYEQIHGHANARRLREIRSIHSINQMSDINQRLLRKQACGKWAEDENEYNMRVNKMRIACSNPDVAKQRRKTLLERYGTDNTLEIQPRFSKMAYNFIKQYIKNNNINENRCYFARGGINNREYVYFDKFNKRHIMFDLVVLAEHSKDIELILEFNGPFHWRWNDVRDNPNSSSTWFKTNSMTKLESYNHDQYKLNIAKTISNNVLVYWLCDKSVERIK
jgi:ROS/MUCR transcriptional regulator protein